MNLTKQQQWKSAHIVVNLITMLQPQSSDFTKKTAALLVLNELYEPLPWEYDWNEVIASVLEQKRRSLAKPK